LAKIPLLKSIEATKLHPKTGTSLGLPDVTLSYGALIEYAGSDRERQREKFTYLGELYACKRETYLSATGGVKAQPKAVAPPVAAGEPATVPPSAPPPASVPIAENAPRIEWERLHSAYPLYRAKAPGGWLVVLNGASVTFVPDPGHRWDGGSAECAETPDPSSAPPDHPGTSEP